MDSVLLLLIVIAVLALYGVSIYNKLVALKNRYQNSFAQIDVQLRRRYDLIPNLVETAKAYLKHERETLEAVTNARNQALAGLDRASANPADASAMRQLGNAESLLSGALGRFSAVMEAYPDLKASDTMTQLSEELTSTENKVAFARQAFNDSVMAYNTYRQSFPPVILASFFGHPRDAAPLDLPERQQLQNAPKVSF